MASLSACQVLRSWLCQVVYERRHQNREEVWRNEFGGNWRFSGDDLIFFRNRVTHWAEASAPRKSAAWCQAAVAARRGDILYAQDRWSLLLIFQAMDAAGKDSTIKHVMSGINPQGCQVFSSSNPRQRTSITTSCGVTSNAFPNVVASAFSTAHITRRCSSCACTRKS